MIPGSWPQALFGGPLHGDKAVKYIYVDEAGTSAKEPVSVVAGIIVDADKQWRVAETAVRDLVRQYVPEGHKSISHCKEIWAGGREIEGWSIPDRLAFMNAMMELPRRLDMPIALGMARRGITSEAPQKLSKAQFEHVIAFQYCVTKADQWMRREADENEVATVICEDVQQVKEPIKEIVRYIRKNPMRLAPELLHQTAEEKRTGKRLQTGELAITRIIGAIHFESKEDGILLQIADACAFAFRRFFSNQPMGKDFVRSVLGSDFRNASDWDGPVSGGNFMWKPPKTVAGPTSSSTVIPFRQIG
jgi:hypothetical protein